MTIFHSLQKITSKTLLQYLLYPNRAIEVIGPIFFDFFSLCVLFFFCLRWCFGEVFCLFGWLVGFFLLLLFIFPLLTLQGSL